MNDEKYYRRELTKLLMIVKTGDDNSMISKEYMLEKLNWILSGNGINLHPSLNLAAMHEDNVYYYEIYKDKIKDYIKQLYVIRGDKKICQKSYEESINRDIIALKRDKKEVELAIVKEKI